MARKNEKAGQPNRGAQKGRHIRRRVLTSEHRSQRRLVLGPGSKELLTRHPIIVRELEEVAA